MGRVLCISSQTVYGPVGNSAAVPALQGEGHEVMQIPTVILSNHPGHGKPAGQATSAAMITDIINTLRHIEAFDGLEAVMTGYFASAAQVVAVATEVALLKSVHQRLHVLVDPVIGDHGALYVPADVATAIRDHLMPLATITTPNLFELTWLTGMNDIDAAVKKQNVSETIVTSVPQGADELATLLFFDNRKDSCVMKRRERVPHGTGDFLAGCYLAQRLQMEASRAFEAAMKTLEVVIKRSAGNRVLTVT